eukprot:4425885-Pyramimonas_sp.AAC.1
MGDERETQGRGEKGETTRASTCGTTCLSNCSFAVCCASTARRQRPQRGSNFTGADASCSSAA